MASNVPPALDHIEKTLADAYRKEIDQEENIWRSLPFFAATIAFQLASLFQLIERLPPMGTIWGEIAIVLLVLSGLATLAALCFLAASIYPVRFDYLAPETELLGYAEGLIEDQRSLEQTGDGGTSYALETLKRALARQYALATTHNRRRNKRRELLRSVAGLATVTSVLVTLFLVGATFVYYVPHRNEEHGHEPGRAASAPTPDYPQRATGAAADPADAGRHQGMVDDARGASPGRAVGEGGGRGCPISLPVPRSTALPRRRLRPHPLQVLGPPR